VNGRRPGKTRAIWREEWQFRNAPDRLRRGRRVRGAQAFASARELDAASGHALRDVLKRGDLEGELGTTLLLHRVPKLPPSACFS
jgi:hypothetical protein